MPPPPGHRRGDLASPPPPPVPGPGQSRDVRRFSGVRGQAREHPRRGDPQRPRAARDAGAQSAGRRAGAIARRGLGGRGGRRLPRRRAGDRASRGQRRAICAGGSPRQVGRRAARRGARVARELLAHLRIASWTSTPRGRSASPRATRSSSPSRSRAIARPATQRRPRARGCALAASSTRTPSRPRRSRWRRGAPMPGRAPRLPGSPSPGRGHRASSSTRSLRRSRGAMRCPSLVFGRLVLVFVIGRELFDWHAAAAPGADDCAGPARAHDALAHLLDGIRAFSRGDRRPEEHASVVALHEALLPAKIQAVIAAAELRHLRIVPHDVLYRVPFGKLALGPSPLARRFSLSLHPTGRLAAATAPARPARAASIGHVTGPDVGCLDEDARALRSGVGRLVPLARVSRDRHRRAGARCPARRRGRPRRPALHLSRHRGRRDLASPAPPGPSSGGGARSRRRGDPPASPSGARLSSRHAGRAG